MPRKVVAQEQARESGARNEEGKRALMVLLVGGKRLGGTSGIIHGGTINGTAGSAAGHGKATTGTALPTEDGILGS